MATALQDETYRLIIKTGAGAATAPPSSDHRNGDWLDTSIYDAELYMDTATGKLYTANGGTIQSFISPFSIGDLSDVDLTGISVNDVLQYDGANFVAAPIGGGGSNLGNANLTADANRTYTLNGSLSTDTLIFKNAAGDNILIIQGDGTVYSNGPGFNTTSTSFGEGALASNTSTGINTAFGYNALNAVTTADQNTAMGRRALEAATGVANTALGDLAGTSITSGSSNVFVGLSAGQNTAVGMTQSTFIGGNAGKTHTSGTHSTLVGYNAGTGLTAGNCTVLGWNALDAASNSSTETVAIGENSMTAATAASRTTCVGVNSGVAITTATNNTLIGHDAGLSITTGSGNTFIGDRADAGSNVSNTVIVAAGNGIHAITKDANHNVHFSDASALATTATNGFVYVRGGAGVPTGVPATSITGHVPMYADTTNNKLYIYSGGSWVALN